jgi:hypothetical protein
LINKVFKQGRLSAIIMDFRHDITTTTFFTEDSLPLQVGAIIKNSSQPVLAHRHNVFERKVLGTSEFLFVLKGAMKLSLFDDDFLNPEEFIVTQGMGVLLLSGGHSIDFEEQTQLIEVKQGPFSAQVDKIYLSELEN